MRRRRAGDGSNARPTGGLALSADTGVLYIADTGANLVRSVTLTSGIITTAAGTGAAGSAGDGGPATSAHSPRRPAWRRRPTAACTWPTRRTTPCDALVADGTISTVAGTGAQLSRPVGVAVDPADGAIVVADTGNHRIRRIARDGVVTSVAGTGRPGNAGDGGAATAASMNGPERAVVGPGGVIYVADTANHRVRVILQGTMWAVAGTGSPASGPAGQASWATGLNAPGGLAITAAGLVVADTANHVLRVMTTPTPGSASPPAARTRRRPAASPAPRCPSPDSRRRRS